MTDRVEHRFHPERSLLIDANLMLVRVVAAIDPLLPLSYKRTRDLALTAWDVAELELFINRFSEWVTTPAVLAEVRNLAGFLPRPALRRSRDVLASLLASTLEVWDDALTLVSRDPITYARLGYPDASVVSAAAAGAHVLTADALLANRLYERGLTVTNFNHLRRL